MHCTALHKLCQGVHFIGRLVLHPLIVCCSAQPTQVCCQPAAGILCVQLHAADEVCVLRP